MMEASLIGGIAISSKWLGACHSLAHPLSSLAGLHHGLACAIMLPVQMEYSLLGAVERYAAVGAALGGNRRGAVRERAEGAVSAVRQLIQDIEIPLRLRDAGVKRDLIPALAKAAMIDLNWWTNPRQVDEGVMGRLYEAAY
jgi:alcohol dehydrogenase class IV